MSELIVGFGKQETGKKIELLLTRRGYSVEAVCRSAAHVLRVTDRLPKGIIICGGKFPDMVFEDFCEAVPRSFQMIIVTSHEIAIAEADRDRIAVIGNPMMFSELVEKIEWLREQRRERRLKRQPRKRAAEDERVIHGAKLLLMNRLNMTEDEAHRYLRRMSMDSGSTLRETAEKIRLIYG